LQGALSHVKRRRWERRCPQSAISKREAPDRMPRYFGNELK
jgi:hypothetical protein